MGSKERRQRHRAQIRRDILAVARELFTADGAGNVSLRRIADRIEYSPAVIYCYFGDKDDMLLALAAEDAAMLDQRVRESTWQVSEPLGRVRRALWAIHEFLATHPLLLDVIISENFAAGMTAGQQPCGWMDGIAAVVEPDIDECINGGQLSASFTAAATLRLLCVGVLGASIVAWRRMADGEHREALAADVIETLLAGLARSATDLQRHPSPRLVTNAHR